MQEYALSSQEGVALMCLAEALLRIPDDATRDALIRDKIGGGDWRAHLGHSPSLFVNAATWGLVLTGRLVDDRQRDGPVGGADAPDRARRRAADPHGRRHGDAPDGRAVRHRRDHRRGAGEQPRAARREGFRYSYDMLGEAAMTAARRASATSRLRAGDPRDRHGRRPAAASTKARASRSSSRRCIRATARAQRERVMAELLPRAARAGAAGARATTSASTSTPRRPTGWSSRSTCWKRCASIRSSPAGTASASSCRPTRSAARS